MTPLAERFQVLVAVIARVVIQMRGRQHDVAPRPLRVPPVPFLAAARAGMRPMEPTLALTLALPLRPRLNPRTDGLPVRGILRALARSDRAHGCFPLTAWRCSRYRCRHRARSVSRSAINACISKIRRAH